MKFFHLSGSIFLILTVMLIIGYACSPKTDRLQGRAKKVASDSTLSFENVTTAIELGRLLFWDPVLSGNGDVACASCHHPDLAYADGRDISIGAGGIGLGADRADATNGLIPPVKRNAHTILNSAFNGLSDRRGRGRGGNDFSDNPADPEVFQTISQERAPMFWDSRVRSLEAQALEPIKAFEEMRGDVFSDSTALDSIVARLKNISSYVMLFEKIYGKGTPISAPLIGSAIADFERTLNAVNSPFDQYIAGNKDALTPQQVRGFESFQEVGCDNCHDGPMFSDFQLHTLGTPENPQLDSTDVGAGRFRFRTPSLRNVALTAPYMHSGMFTTLADVLDFYDEGRSQNPNVSNDGGGRGRGRNGRGGPRGDNGPFPDGNDNRLAFLDGDFRRIDNMNDQEKSDIIAFLNALTDEDFDRTIPKAVPSRLTPGGNILP